MGFIDKLEQRLEKAVRGTFTKGGSTFEPVDVANRVRTEMDNKAYSIASGRTLAPNIFTISFAEDDYPRVEGWGAPLAEELCDVAIRHARAQGYSLRGSVRVTFIVDQELEQGDFEIVSAQEKIDPPSQSSNSQRPHRPEASQQGQPQTRLQTAAQEHAPRIPHRITRPAVAPRTQQHRTQQSQAHVPAPQVVLEINGQNYSVQALPVVLGRGSNADITVEDTGVSRRHLEVIVQDGTYLAVDLGSTNGSFVNGEKLAGRRKLNNGDVITMGRARIVFRLMVQRSER